MESEMTDFDPDCKACRAIAVPADGAPLRVWESEFWVLKHTGAPYAELGWMTLHSRRHATAFTELTDAELADFGRTVKRVQEALVKATGALRVYFVSMTESTPHVHAHLVPRYADGPKGWDTWMLKTRPGSRNVSEEDVARVIKEVAETLRN
jgi:diadenosine tetraphosphate (Ap4A) HIT family hydrolase